MKLSEFLEGVGRPVAYYPGLARVLGDMKEAVFVCQMAYWKDKGSDPDGWIYKSSEEIEAETALSYKEQINIRAGLETKNLLESWYERTEHRMYFRVNWDALNTLWDKHMTDGHMPVGHVPSDQREDEDMTDGQVPPDQKADGTLPKVSSLKGTTENTHEITPENTTEKDGFLQVFQACARTHWPHDVKTARKVYAVLAAAQFERVDGTIRISGLGLQAGLYQDRYAKSFARDQAGRLGEMVTIEFCE